MATIYFPSCKFSAFSPESSQKICNYLQTQHNMIIGECCRKGRLALTKEDTAVFICHTCRAICAESSAAGQTLSLWEIMDGAPQLSLPDYKGLELSIQDCWRSFDKVNEQKAVRNLLTKMNISIIEQEDNFEKTKFCGTSLFSGAHEENNMLAPKRFGGSNIFISLAEEEQISHMKAHCKNIITESVLCYCVTCAMGINAGGKKAIHLLDLIYNKS